MSGWIDPLGLRCLHRYIRFEQQQLAALILALRNRQQGKRYRKYNARYQELSRLAALLQALERPGKELLPFKDLVQSAGPERRAKVVSLMKPHLDTGQYP